MALRVADDGRVRLLTIDRPERRNAVDLTTLIELKAALDAARADAVRVVVLTGAPPAFCSGADLTGVEGDEFGGALRAALAALTELPAATIAAVDGPALGAGTQLASACDLRVATAGSRFAIPAAKLGLMVDTWTVRRVSQLFGGGPARAMLLAAESYDGEAAHRLGFVQRIGDLAAALAWAAEIAALAPLTVAGHKLSLERATTVEPDDPDVTAALARAWASRDAHEGRTAFLDKRPAAFEGR
jgi:enoyl-CoA hydratase